MIELRTNPDRKLSVGTNRYKYIAFHNGRLLPDLTLAWIIDAAIRGSMTPSGAQLLLIPDTRKGPPDTSGLRQIGKFRKSDCLTLKQLIRKIGKTEGCHHTAHTVHLNVEGNLTDTQLLAGPVRLDKPFDVFSCNQKIRPKTTGIDERVWSQRLELC